MNKVITASINLQAFYKKDFTPDLQEAGSIDTLFREKLSTLERRVFSYFCKTQLIYDGRVYISQEVVAANFGISREWLNKIVGKLKRLGLIDSYYRHMQTSLYRVSPYFNNPQVQYLLRHLVGAFYFTVDLLKSQLQKPLSRNSSHNNINKRYIYSPCTILRLTPEVKKPARGYKNKILEIPGYISSIKFIPLTQAGQIKLCAFSEKTVKYSLYQLKKIPHVKNLFNCLVKICLNYCKNNKIRPDWDLVAQLKAKFSVPIGADMITQPIIQPPQKPKQPSSEYLVPKLNYIQEYLKYEAWKLTDDFKRQARIFPFMYNNPYELEYKRELEKQIISTIGES